MGNDVQRDGDWERELVEMYRGRWLGHRARAYVTCPSTQPLAWRWVREGAPHGGIVVAREQTAGKGRFDRAWWTGRGGLALTLILRPDIPTDRLGMFAWLTAAGLLRALATLGVEGKVKWPNDVLLPLPDRGHPRSRDAINRVSKPMPPTSSCHPDKRNPCLSSPPLLRVRGRLQRGSRSNEPPCWSRLGKWAGILPQSAIAGQKVDAVVIGIGFNVRRPDCLPLCADQAAFLSDVGIERDDQTVLHHVLEGLQSVFDELLGRGDANSENPISTTPFQEWRRACVTLGQVVRVRVDGEVVTGWAMDVTPAGALIIRQSDGGERRVHAGEATIVKGSFE
ncbi:MAG: biotin--[acetyl-CoA-carboxylase] ligase [Myxococcota bacterium]